MLQKKRDGEKQGDGERERDAGGGCKWAIHVIASKWYL